MTHKCPGVKHTMLALLQQQYKSSKQHYKAPSISVLSEYISEILTLKFPTKRGMWMCAECLCTFHIPHTVIKPGIRLPCCQVMII